MKKLLLILMIAFLSTYAANAVTPNGPTVKTTDAVAPSETKTTTGDTYYWFDVSPDGSSLLDASGIPLSQGQTEQGECQGNDDEFCQRGYTEAQTTISGGKRIVNVAVTASAAQDRKQ